MKRPKFKRDSVGRKQIEDRWRKPTGKTSKLRLGRRGKGLMVKIGYKKSVPAPLPIRVFRPEDLSKVNDKDKVIIASGVGAKKKEAILNKAKEMKIKISNVRE